VSVALSRLAYLRTGRLVESSEWPTMSIVANRLSLAILKFNQMVPRNKLRGSTNNMVKGIRRAKLRLEQEFCFKPNFVSLILSSELCNGTKPKVVSDDRQSILNRYPQSEGGRVSPEIEGYLFEGSARRASQM
jgi:hypothetical protein